MRSRSEVGQTQSVSGEPITCSHEPTNIRQMIADIMAGGGPGPRVLGGAPPLPRPVGPGLPFSPPPPPHLSAVFCVTPVAPAGPPGPAARVATAKVGPRHFLRDQFPRYIRQRCWHPELAVRPRSPAQVAPRPD